MDNVMLLCRSELSIARETNTSLLMICRHPTQQRKEVLKSFMEDTETFKFLFPENQAILVNKFLVTKARDESLKSEDTTLTEYRNMHSEDATNRFLLYRITPNVLAALRRVTQDCSDGVALLDGNTQTIKPFNFKQDYRKCTHPEKVLGDCNSCSFKHLIQGNTLPCLTHYKLNTLKEETSNLDYPALEDIRTHMRTVKKLGSVNYLDCIFLPFKEV